MCNGAMIIGRSLILLGRVGISEQSRRPIGAAVDLCVVAAGEYQHKVTLEHTYGTPSE